MKRFMLGGVLAVVLSMPALAGPQHWGFGFGYLVTIEENEKSERALSVYEPPMRVTDGEWLLRWRDTSDQYKDVPSNCLAVGNFWPEAMGGTEHVATVYATRGTDRYRCQISMPPAVFSTRAWKTLSDGELPGRPTSVPWLLGVSAGDVLGRGRDQLITLHEAGTSPCAGLLRVFEAPSAPNQADWRLLGEVRLRHSLGRCSNNVAAGDFWGNGRDVVALLLESDEGAATVYLRLEQTLDGELVTNEIGRSQLPNVQGRTSFFVATDFLKDGFAYLASAAWVPSAPDAPRPAQGNWPDQTLIQLHTAPRLANKLFNTCWIRSDETFAGAKLTGQKVGESRHIMSGRRQAPFGRVVAAGAGRIFGYVTAGVDERKAKLWKPWQYHGYNDVEIAFAHRTPVYQRGMPKKWQDAEWPWEPDEHFGWPLKDEEVAYEVSLKNNGKEPIPPGTVTLRAWVNTPDRNADILRPGQADFSVTVSEPIPPFDPTKPQYTLVKIPVKWPYDLEQPHGWSWKRINVRQVGERWLVLQIECAGDENERNDRYELALNSLLFRPVWRFDVDAPPQPSPDGLEGRPDRKINTLAYRAPCVAGDPESKEYNGRKLADAVQCMWERSRTSDGGDVWQRVVFDSYRLYDPQGRNGLKPLNRADDWLYYEGPREGEHWVGLWGDYERFDPRDGGAELHETGHLFHPVGDLYHYFINPTVTRRAHMADGSSVQMNTYCWGLDSFCSGHAIIGEADSDYQRYMEGARLALGAAWHRILPKKINVRVLDRDGGPVPCATVSFWPYGDEKPFSTGTTDSQGRWDPGINKQPGDVYDIFNLPQYQDPVLDAIGHILTVDFDGYSDFMIWGAEDVAAHSRYTLLQACLKHPDEWTWDFKTLYKAGAPSPTLDVTAAVQGRQIKLQMKSPDRTADFRVYRRWEPTYVFERVMDHDPAPPVHGTFPDGASAMARPHFFGSPVEFTDDMGAADWYMQGRYRAAYYVTEIIDGVESLPKRVYGIALDHVNGVSNLGDGQLIVAANCGKSEPFGVLCRGTTPVEECIKHFRFGHTAAKLVGSPANPQRYYATLVSSDMPWGADRFFDLIQFDKPDLHNDTYPVVQTIAECDVTQFSTAAPYTVTVRPDPDARTAVNAGDWAFADDTRARILAVDEAGSQLTLDKPLFQKDQQDGLHLRIEFGGGTPGDKAELRELKNSRGLAVVTGHDGKEYIVIADTGNRRVVVWDDTTRFVRELRPISGGLDPPDMNEFQPVAVATYPGIPGMVFVLDRRSGTTSWVWQLHVTYAAADPGIVINGDPREGFNLDSAGRADEIGLAIGVEPGTGRRAIAITDASSRRVFEARCGKMDASGRWSELPTGDSAELTHAVGAFAGDARLTNPTDVAYTIENGELRLYAVDGHNRIVRLR